LESNKTGTLGRGEKILLAMLPFNDPQIPPLGIANLKSFLERHGYEVFTADANVEIEFREIYDSYFDAVTREIPGDKQGNANSMKLDILQNHLTAYLTYRKRLETPGYRNLAELVCEKEEEYVELVKILIRQTFFLEVADGLVQQLDEILAGFFQRLEDYYLHLLEETRPKVVGLSVCIGMMAASLYAFKLTKELYPHIRTVMGGGIYADDLALNSTNLRYFAEKTPYIDRLLVGEGEVLFLKFLQGELPESQKVCSMYDIPGEALDLAEGWVPDFDDFHLDRYPFLSYNASVGCPFNCNFCTIPVQWGKYRQKSAGQVAAELIRLYRRYGSQLFLLVDSLLNPLIGDLAREFIAADVCIYWDGSLRVSPAVCNPDNTLLWRKGGFYRAHLGIESGSQRILDAMDKRTTLDQIKTALSSLASAGIKTTTFWVVGYPGESEDDFLQSLQLAEELKEDIYETTIRPYLYYEMKQEYFNRGLIQHKSIPLYPGYAREKLLTETWIMDVEPSREETVRRLNRFDEHIRKLGIPNPYSLFELNEADRRWQKLHENAVPPVIRFKDKNQYIDECKSVEKIFPLQNRLEDDGIFGF
jgi:hypothetical protein